MRTIMLGICICFATTVLAQRQCASAEYLEQQKSIDVNYSSKINAVENFISHQSSFGSKLTGEGSSIIRIPVVVHVLYNNTAQNISDAQIKSQIDALNRDFRRQNADSLNTPARFKSIAADIQIEFFLATADYKGRATSGIVRKQTNVVSWSSDDKIKFSAQGGDDAWDSRYYLNFWVGNLGTLLGYSSVPGGAAGKDGVAINFSVFGTINTTSPYNLGRTVVHEVGHWLGLIHIWGDTYCGDDKVDDTPVQGNFTSGCPNNFRSSCNNGSMGDMYMNYMDYTNDACLNLFTEGQKQRMHSLFNMGGPRNLILSSKGLDKPWSTDSPVADIPALNNQFKFYPNPAITTIALNFDYNTNWVGKIISIVNMNGSVLLSVQIKSKSQSINIAQLKPGMYFIKGENGNDEIREKFIKL